MWLQLYLRFWNSIVLKSAAGESYSVIRNKLDFYVREHI